MAFRSGEAHLSLLSLFTLTLVVHCRPSLNPSDHDAVLLIQEDLGVNGQLYSRHSPCNSVGVFCERRFSNNSYLLRITRLSFKSQRLAGFLSPAIGRLSELSELSLADNDLVNQIPTQIVRCRKLETLNLKNNRFSGEVPYELSSITRLKVLDLSSNKFSGNLNFLKYFPSLEKLSLANNMFTGRVPASLRSFRNLQFFNISGNSFLEGPVPVMSRGEYASPESVEKNALPKRHVFAERNVTAERNGSHAIGPSASSSESVGSPAQAPSVSATPHKHHKKPRAIIVGFLVGAVAGSVCGCGFSVMFKVLLIIARGRRKTPGAAIFSALIKKAEDLDFLQKEDGLASLELIGSGGCGKVYKAELPGSNGKFIAIKKIDHLPKDADDLAGEDSRALNKKLRQIRSEIQTVGQIRHRNLLPLLAHVAGPDCHFLVYEFMKNGSLQDMLVKVSEGQIELDWLARHGIAAGVASGLEYLHFSRTPRIIHRDLKPGNILLDDDMVARIADFGLAKAVPDANTHVTTSNVAGTVGYIAPEYHQTLKFTDKCDIYSFGVLLGILVMGKLPSDDFFQNTSEMSLVKWMRNVMMSEDPKRAIDPELMGKFEEQMLQVLKIACFCTIEDPKQRPNSKEVRLMLSQIVH